MKQRQLGKNGPMVSALGLGCMGMSDFYTTGLDEKESLATLERALEIGVTMFDTADPSSAGFRDAGLLNGQIGGFYNAVFQGPYGMSLSIQVVATPGETFVDLIEKLRKIERNLSADTHMDFAYVGPHRAA